MAVVIAISVASLFRETTDMGLTHRAVCPFIPPLSLVLRVYSRRDGQAELACATGYIPG